MPDESELLKILMDGVPAEDREKMIEALQNAPEPQPAGRRRRRRDRASLTRWVKRRI